MVLLLLHPVRLSCTVSHFLLPPFLLHYHVVHLSFDFTSFLSDFYSLFDLLSTSRGGLVCLLCTPQSVYIYLASCLSTYSFILPPLTTSRPHNTSALFALDLGKV